MDRDLVERAQRGDESAFAVLAVRIGDRLHAVAHHVLRDGDLASDAAQQAMIEIWRKLPSLRDPDQFMAWAYRITIRAAYAEATRGSLWKLKVTSIDRKAVEPESHGRGDDLGQVDARDQLDRGFRRLPIDHRAVVVLKHYAELSNAEIAEALDIPEGTVRSRLHHSMRALRAALDADDRPAREAVAR